MNPLIRDFVARTVQCQNVSERADILNPAKTQDDLIAMLYVMLQQNHVPLITSLRTDHSDDSALGPHGHARGYAVDLWIGDNRSRLFEDCVYKNHYVTKIGLGGSFKHLSPERTTNSTIIFYDNDSEHIHLQTA